MDWKPSAVSALNGKDPIKFLKEFAAQNALGSLESNTDFNQLMSSPAGDVQGILSAFEGSSPFYPGDTITFDFENQTTTDALPWLATYSAAADAPIINNGVDFYNYFVLGLDPQNPTDSPADTSSGGNATTASIASATGAATATDLSASSTTSSADAATSTPPGWDYFPYPANPDVIQPNLGDDNGGVITGYFLNDGETAVLSIPSFDVNGEAIESFSSTIGEFIQKSKAAKYQRVIIDVQRNDGGGDLLATDAFKQVRPQAIIFTREALTVPSSFQTSTHLGAVVFVRTIPQMLSVPRTRKPLCLPILATIFMNNWLGTHGLRHSTSTQRPGIILQIGASSMGLIHSTATTSQPLHASPVLMLCPTS